MLNDVHERKVTGDRRRSALLRQTLQSASLRILKKKYIYILFLFLLSYIIIIKKINVRLYVRDAK